MRIHPGIFCFGGTDIGKPVQIRIQAEEGTVFGGNDPVLSGVDAFFIKAAQQAIAAYLEYIVPEYGRAAVNSCIYCGFKCTVFSQREIMRC